jgi:L-alanine-DL-glutamate epimerase-like enolase superfamily enzyme
MTGRITEITLRRLSLPLTVPYKVSLKAFTEFAPIVAEIRDSDGRAGWGEAEIHHGYGDETPEGGWQYCRAMAERLVGLSPEQAKALIAPTIARNTHAASVLMSAIETIEEHPALTVMQPAVVPLLAPVNAMAVDAVPDEIERLIASGFRTLKVKVGFDVTADLHRVAAIQRAAAGRATLRLDANQAFTRAEGERFAAALDRSGIAPFEQPCDKADWASNAAVARVSTVPVMLDESIYGMPDIDRAATIPGVGFIKLKLKKLGSIDMLIAGLRRIRDNGLEPVLGDGTATDIACRLEACVAVATIGNAGEMNGFLKLRRTLLDPGLVFADGAIRLPAGYRPAVDRAALDAHETAHERFAAARVAVAS